MILDPSPLFLPTTHNVFCSESFAVLMDLEVQTQKNQRFDTSKRGWQSWFSIYSNINVIFLNLIYTVYLTSLQTPKLYNHTSHLQEVLDIIYRYVCICTVKNLWLFTYTTVRVTHWMDGDREGGVYTVYMYVKTKKTEILVHTPKLYIWYTVILIYYKYTPSSSWPSSKVSELVVSVLAAALTEFSGFKD